jgi:uracil-DNA glycosylase family 4
LADCRAVLSRANGDLHARILFVAEAPGRLGGARTGIPLAGDQSGRNFERLLAAAGLERREVFITNAVLCNPRDERGRNAAPTTREIHNCSPFLRRTIDLVDPLLVIALGVVALKALALIVPHEIELRRDVAQPFEWDRRILIGMYHPSPRAQLHRSLIQQCDDFATLRPLLAELMTAAA